MTQPHVPAGRNPAPGAGWGPTGPRTAHLGLHHRRRLPAGSAGGKVAYWLHRVFLFFFWILIFHQITALKLHFPCTEKKNVFIFIAEKDGFNIQPQVQDKRRQQWKRRNCSHTDICKTKKLGFCNKMPRFLYTERKKRERQAHLQHEITPVSLLRTRKAHSVLGA